MLIHSTGDPPHTKGLGLTSIGADFPQITDAKIKSLYISEAETKENYTNPRVTQNSHIVKRMSLEEPKCLQ